MERVGQDGTGHPIARRRFLLGAAAATVAVASGCGSDGGDGSDAGGTGSTSGADRANAAAPGTEAVDRAAIDAQAVAAGAFSLGVASGDPVADAVVIWTRLAPDPLASDGSGGMGPDDLDVAWEVASDEAFDDVVLTGTTRAEAGHGHSCHVDVVGLEPATTYWYRFHVGGQTSPAGRTRTLPDGDADQLRLAIANCQMYDGAAYAAYRHMAEEDFDLVLHLGDYVYEYPGQGAAAGGSEPAHLVTTLADYRLRYASYKLDEHLRTAHAALPFVVTWDDHEVANNYTGDTLPDGTPAEEVRARRAAAYQAWWEHLPVRLPAPVDGALDVHRAFQAGSLARLHVLDQRQHADTPPCRTEEGPNLDVGYCEEIGEDRSLLGADQERWLSDGLSEGGVTWNLIGNPIVLAGIDIGAESPVHYLETWDGYPEARKRMISSIAGASNPVVLTGDYHAGMVLDVHEDPFDAASPVVAAELMSPPISSVLFDADVSARTPHLREQTNAHGYLAVEVTPQRLTARFRVLDDVGDPDSAISTSSTWVVDAGDPVAHPG